MTFSLSGPVLLPLAGSAIACDPTLYDQAALLRVIDRSYPADYVFSIKSKPNGGYELLQAAAAVLARVSVAVGHLYCCAFLMSAEGGLPALGAVELYRADPGAGAITILPGTVVATVDGREFVLTSTATFGALALGPIQVSVRSVAVGHEYNVPGQVTTASGAVLPGAIDRIKKLVTAVPAIDPNMRVRQLAATSGGRDACLDGLAADLLIFRQGSEDDRTLRVRILETPDTVSPLALQRGADKILQAVGSAACLREVGTAKLPGLFYDAGSSLDSPQVPANNYAYDFDFSIRPQDRFKLWLSSLEFRGFFLVGVPPIVEPNRGLFYDGLSADAHPLRNAYDTSSSDLIGDDPDAYYDGVAVKGPAIYQALFEMLKSKHAGGVGFDLYVETLGCF